MRELTLVFQHTDFYVLNKPAGAPMHANTEELSVVHQLAHQLQEELWRSTARYTDFRRAAGRAQRNRRGRIKPIVCRTANEQNLSGHRRWKTKEKARLGHR